MQLACFLSFSTRRNITHFALPIAQSHVIPRQAWLKTQYFGTGYSCQYNHWLIKILTRLSHRFEMFESVFAQKNRKIKIFVLKTCPQNPLFCPCVCQSKIRPSLVINPTYSLAAKTGDRLALSDISQVTDEE